VQRRAGQPSTPWEASFLGKFRPTKISQRSHQAPRRTVSTFAALRLRWRCRLLACALLWLAAAGPLGAQESANAEPAASRSAPTAGEPVASPTAAEEIEPPAPEARTDDAAATPDSTSSLGSAYRATAAAIDELRSGTLSVATDPASLFDVPLGDSVALSLEAARLEALLGQREGETSAPPERVSSEVWEARRKLDRSRLEFYRLPAKQRDALLAAHAERQQADAQTPALEASAEGTQTAQAAEATQRAQAAEAERQRALAQAEVADSEAERLVVEERARLLGVASRLAEQQAEVARDRTTLNERTERTLSLGRQVREIVGGPRTEPEKADALYLDLRDWLRASRAELRDALRAALPRPALVREVDPLVNLPSQVDRTEVDELYERVVATAALLAEQTADYQGARSAQLYGEVQALNDDRLALLPYLSADRRRAIVGFGAVGADQALAELRQVGLVIRYHAASVSAWLASGAWRTWNGRVAGSATVDLFQAVLVLVVFLWARRTVRASLESWRRRIRETARRARRLQSAPADDAIGMALRVVEPVGWLVLVLAIVWVLPGTITSLMEFRLFETVLRWSFAGWLAVATIDHLAMRRARRMGWRRQSRTDSIRLRSLRLLGVAVVVVGLILSLSHQIVGAGTVYSWVIRTCWWMALPVGLLIVHWWRDVIFERLGYIREAPFAQWALARREGWRGLLCAAAGGAYLFTKGTATVSKAWLGSFEITRRLGAYLFRQHLERMSDRTQSKALAPLPASAFAALSPSTLSEQSIRNDDDPQVAQIIDHIDRTGGGVYAVVGERGSGRSTVLHRVSDSREDVVFIECPFTGLEDLTNALCKALSLPKGMALEELAASLDARDADIGVIIDNAHRFIHPVMGGLAGFDRLIESARRHSARCAWIISIDRVVWRFLERARSVDLLFDGIVTLDEWSEEDIATLIRNRSKQAGIEPRFDRLVPDLTFDTDERERAEALTHAENSYYRLIWDYAVGNPGIALHTWRTSLGVAPDGRVFVTPFRVPDSGTFEKLPDSAVFVLRAVLQLERALPVDVSKATLVAVSEVESSLRFGVQNGYLRCEFGRYAVAWNWYGPITRFLQRRHLLAST
jgi:AAA domain